MLNPSRPAALGAAVLSVLLLAGCSAPEPSDQDDDWTSRMEHLLTDPAGQGGAGGRFTADDGDGDADEQDSVAQVILGTVAAGRYDVLGVCRDGDFVHLSVKSLAGVHEPEKTYADTDIACGATVRLPVTIDATDVTIEASGPVGADWRAMIVSPDWQPTLATFG